MKAKYSKNLATLDEMKHRDNSLKQEMRMKLEEKQQQINVLQVNKINLKKPIYNFILCDLQQSYMAFLCIILYFVLCVFYSFIFVACNYLKISYMCFSKSVFGITVNELFSRLKCKVRLKFRHLRA